MSDYELRTEKILKELSMTVNITRLGVFNPPFSKGSPVYKYQVGMSRRGAKIQFSFYDSVNNYQQGKRPTKYDVMNVFVSEASSGLNLYSPQDVASEFGYQDNMKEATRVYKGLKKMGEKARRLGLSIDDLGRIGNYIENGER